MLFRKVWMTAAAVILAAGAAHAKTQKFAPPVPLSPEQSALVQKAIAQEKTIVKAIQQHTPVVQTYIQNMRPDPQLYSVPDSDQYMLGRVDFSKAFYNKGYEAKPSRHGFFKGSMNFLSGLTKSFDLSYSPTGFMDMMFLDPVSFDQQHYDFSYVRREFLGSIRTMVFDVHPKPGTGAGRFFGRIWIEDQDGNIVRFNGTYTNSKNSDITRYYHFDSWRMNLQPEVWLPVAIYVEESEGGTGKKHGGFRAQTHFWGYSLKLPQRESEAESIVVENAQDQSENSQDVGPLGAKRQWVAQAEQNVLDRLVQAGLLAPPSDFDKVLEQVTNNIIIGNKLDLPADIHCRVILTTPLESLAVGNTILLSKGLIDVLPTEEDLAAVISFQLAHIVLGHHIDTRYAFNDRLLFPDEATFQRINMSHTPADDEAAAKKAVELFDNSIYHDKSASVSLFFQQVVAREKYLPGLLSPRLGDPLLKADGTPWLSAFLNRGPKLNLTDMNQQLAALPLGSHLKADPWDDKVYALNIRQEHILNPSDKMPLELTPVYFRLQRYQPPAAAASLPAGQQPVNGSAPADSNTPPQQPDNNTPQPQQTQPQPGQNPQS
ncbi:hypothetical protein [Pseudacidobacterium ailaaui]|jgi:hypothetical protein|uniref:hypothetical protein n=1 Tax=Pseudacidobacterium ailaaui TaxID=1382359 RepID=UPI00047A8C67|nr:hypothetical protein [Pseudacidobacterium ailaaui]MBX6360260.1 hypothetical protein [Pseudacidobacterium ailaaui]MDI3253739.1 hypothetical protein [Bacillota bacterium]